ncbi:ETS translocation variant 4-like [Periplaneta americana]|uniref:ETS translocation variant 4-like n=1 Tax=Periplaneta americana TaxID=6978 RepID=UPI0037E909DD
MKERKSRSVSRDSVLPKERLPVRIQILVEMHLTSEQPSLASTAQIPARTLSLLGLSLVLISGSAFGLHQSASAQCLPGGKAPPVGAHQPQGAAGFFSLQQQTQPADKTPPRHQQEGDIFHEFRQAQESWLQEGSSCETDDSEQYVPEFQSHHHAAPPGGCSNIKQEPRSPGLFKPCSHLAAPCPYPGSTAGPYSSYSSYAPPAGFPTPCSLAGLHKDPVRGSASRYTPPPPPPPRTSLEPKCDDLVSTPAPRSAFFNFPPTTCFRPTSPCERLTYSHVSVKKEPCDRGYEPDLQQQHVNVSESVYESSPELPVSFPVSPLRWGAWYLR